MLNVLPPTRSTSAVNNRISPFEAFHAYQPRTLHIRAYGCRMWVEAPKETRDTNYDMTMSVPTTKQAPSKMADRRIPKLYLGCHSPSIVIALDPVTRSVSFHRFADTVFEEMVFPGLGHKSLPPSQPIDLSTSHSPTRFVDDSLKDQDAELQATLERRARMMLDPISTLADHNIPRRPGIVIPSNLDQLPSTDVEVSSFCIFVEYLTLHL